ncbi:hypothetical protein OV079_07550 [Nannocystis pusilla]|uniref:Uncharacterized protein n=1 Tax=Nannocystis pusilla TaxID=889268 RepID=A0A9X3IVI7_9BACT|nr:hypothetical protein [Nannocystis pusilla]MCY1005426.1 hypothetical protein [Nannocystis pusilla]
MPARAVLFLALVLIACGHTSRLGEEAAEAPEPVGPPQDQAKGEVEAEVEVEAPAKQAPTAQVITFSGDDADPEPPAQIRSPPKRPPIPSFQLFGTRPTDGPQ